MSSNPVRTPVTIQLIPLQLIFFFFFFCLVSSNRTPHVYNFFQAKNQGDCMLIFGLICKTPPLLVFSTKSCHLCLPSWQVQLLRLPPSITWSSKCLQAEIQGDCRAHLICFLFLGPHSLVTESSYFWYFVHISHILSSSFLLQESWSDAGYFTVSSSPFTICLANILSAWLVQTLSCLSCIIESRTKPKTY